MPSPFPGMDPYLEGYLWPDVHHALATQIRRLLIPRLRPKYVARLEISVIEDENPELELGVMYPDVEVLRRREPLPAGPAGASPVKVIDAPTLTIPLPEVKLVSVEVRDVAQNELITSIEILSPVNKRESGASQYRQKRLRLREAGVHLLELDLLRRGEHPIHAFRKPQCHYLVSLTRAAATQAALWPLTVRDRLPTVPVPLRAPDEDVPLELGKALSTIYDEAAYDLSIDYSAEPPPPPLSAEDWAWMQAVSSEQ